MLRAKEEHENVIKYYCTVSVINLFYRNDCYLVLKNCLLRIFNIIIIKFNCFI